MVVARVSALFSALLSASAPATLAVASTVPPASVRLRTVTAAVITSAEPAPARSPFTLG